ncbi:MAG TPA: response regulator [Anaerolineae bacterium]|nr:response regulator [Anaerolineae bacterium]
MRKPLALIVEDEPRLADLFSMALSPDFDTQIAYDGQIALNKIAEMTPEIIILDLHLPGISGKDILRQIKADERLSQSRIIITTADGVVSEELREEVDIVLLKPLSMTQLKQLANRLCLNRLEI